MKHKNEFKKDIFYWRFGGASHFLPSLLSSLSSLQRKFETLHYPCPFHPWYN